ncbi:MAG: DNRLRE domain-containing protein [Anaerolineae bacterium]
MKRWSLALLVLLLTTALVLPPGVRAVNGNGTPPEAWVSPLMPVQYRVPNFNISYQAESYDDPLAYVELWYRYSVDLCTFTPWTFWARDHTCAGQYDCGATFAFTAPVQAYYEVIMLAYDQGEGVEDQDWDEEDDWVFVDYSDPIIGWPPNPAPGAVVKGTINVSTYFNDSWGLMGVAIWDETWGGFEEVWTGWPPCFGGFGVAPGWPEQRAPQAEPPASGPKAGKALPDRMKGCPSDAPSLKVVPPTGKKVQALGSAGLPAGNYSVRWDTTTVPDGPVEICFYAEDYGYDSGDFWYGNYTERCMTVFVNNYTAREPLLLSATASSATLAATGASERTVTFVGLALPPGKPAGLWVEARVEGAGGFAQESEHVTIGPDYRWSYSIALPEGDHLASFRTRGDNGTASPWVTLEFNPANLPARLTMLTRGYDGYIGAAETFLNLWEPNANFGWAKLLKVRSYGVKKGLARFDLGPLAGVSGAQVARAALVVWNEGQTNPQPLVLRAYPVTAPWDPLQANWLQAATGVPWTLPGAGAVPDDYLPEPTASAALPVQNWAVLDVTEFVQSWLDGTLPNQGFLLMGESRGAVRYTLATSLHTQPGYRPILLVEWNP